MRLDEGPGGADLVERLNAVLPAGIRVVGMQEVDEKAPAVQTQVLFADYEVSLRGPVDLNALEQQVDALLEAESLPRQRRDRQYDLRPLIEGLRVRPSTPAQGAILDMRLKAQEGATGRPDEVLLALGISREDTQIERTALHFGGDRAAQVSNTG
jgi:radical SAM-linked protein